MINITDKKKCSGCTACISSCKYGAITMKPDVFGFLYPHVDKTKCVECGLCVKVCPFNKNYSIEENLEVPYAYAARHININEVLSSQSGAAFIAISDFILSIGGVIYGVGYGENFKIEHRKAINKHEVSLFKGSKYVQSDLNGIFPQIKEELKKGINVLFVGTPCQTAGLRSFIPKRLKDNLYVVDLVCHGVAGPQMWKDFLIWAEKKYKKKILKVSFRDKRFGWHSCKETFYFDNSDNCVVSDYQIYSEKVIRLSCYVCPFCNTKRPSDLTISDFWGIEKITDKFNDNKGCSLILCNTEKGVKLFEKSKANMSILEVNLEQCLQPNLRYPTPYYEKRLELEKDYEKKGFNYITVKYGGLTLKRRIKLKLIKVYNKIISNMNGK